MLSRMNIARLRTRATTFHTSPMRTSSDAALPGHYSIHSNQSLCSNGVIKSIIMPYIVCYMQQMVSSAFSIKKWKDAIEKPYCQPSVFHSTHLQCKTLSFLTSERTGWYLKKDNKKDSLQNRTIANIFDHRDEIAFAKFKLWWRVQHYNNTSSTKQ